MQIPVISGIYAASGSPEFRTSYPRNMIPVPKQHGINAGYIRPAHGIVQDGTGPGPDRGAICWNGSLYRVMGSQLVRISEGGAAFEIGSVGDGGPAVLDYGFEWLSVVSGGRLYHYNGSTFARVIDVDLGVSRSVVWLGGYCMTTDGTSIVVSELTDPFSINPLKYGSAEADPDEIMAVSKLRNEAYALGRYTIEAFENIGGSGFPFQRIDGAQVQKGIVGPRAFCRASETFVFVGSGRNEALGVYQMAPGQAQKISTREIDTILQGYTEAELADVAVELRAEKNHEHVLIHLPDQCLVFDLIATAAMQSPVWFSLTSSVVGRAQYRARDAVWCYGRWNVGDPSSSVFGHLDDSISTHYGEVTGWDFGTVILYNDGAGAIVHELELTCLTGHVAANSDPVIWTQYSLDGERWSQERSLRAGVRGERVKRLAWRQCGKMDHWRIQRFRGTSDAHLTISRLDARIEPLFGKDGGANG